MDLTWKYSCFDELSTSELYAILQLRNAVFVIEQGCVYQDADNKDEDSIHMVGWVDKTIVAYCRILPPGISYMDASIGRVVVSPGYRNFGYGRELMKLAVVFALERFNCKKITIGAQLYLKEFYKALGFVQISETYLEDNIPHIEMQFTA